VLNAGRHRIPFFENYTTAADTLPLHRRLYAQQIAEDHIQLAADLCLELFDYFGWNPAKSQIEQEIDRFYRREWAY
jgi:hypothetical protein